MTAPNSRYTGSTRGSAFVLNFPSAYLSTPISKDVGALVARKLNLSGFAIASQARKDVLGMMLQLHQEYGDFFSVSLMPGFRNYLVYSPALAYEVLVKQADKFHKPDIAKKMFRSSFGNGIFFSAS